MKLARIFPALVLVASATGASAITIDFEDGIPPVNNRGVFTYASVDDYYFSRYGLTFIGAKFQQPSSGEFEEFGSFSIFSNAGLTPSSISIFFETPVSQVSIDQLWSPSNFSTSLVAFKPLFTTTPFPQVAWEIVDSDSFSITNPSGCCGPYTFTLTVAGEGIQRVDISPSNLVFGTSGFEGIFDNLTFTPVPLPPAAALFVTAVWTLGALVRRAAPK